MFEQVIHYLYGEAVTAIWKTALSSWHEGALLHAVGVLMGVDIAVILLFALSLATATPR
jgi:hypothetical protein